MTFPHASSRSVPGASSCPSGLSAKLGPGFRSVCLSVFYFPVCRFANNAFERGLALPHSIRGTDLGGEEGLGNDGEAW